MCRKYGSSTDKPLLPAFSCHLGTVKQALVKGSISCVQKRSCYHLVGSALQRQVARFKSAGYSDRFILSVLERGLSKERQVVREHEKEREKLVVIPFLNAFSNNLKALAKPFGVRIVFKNYFKLPRYQGGKNAACTVKHREPVGDSVMGSVLDPCQMWTLLRWPNWTM